MKLGAAKKAIHIGEGEKFDSLRTVISETADPGSWGALKLDSLIERMVHMKEYVPDIKQHLIQTGRGDLLEKSKAQVIAVLRQDPAFRKFAVEESAASHLAGEAGLGLLNQSLVRATIPSRSAINIDDEIAAGIIAKVNKQVTEDQTRAFSLLFRDSWEARAKQHTQIPSDSEWKAIFASHPLLSTMEVPAGSFQDVTRQLADKGLYGGGAGVTKYLDRIFKERQAQITEHMGAELPKDWIQYGSDKALATSHQAIERQGQEGWWPFRSSPTGGIDIQQILSGTQGAPADQWQQKMISMLKQPSRDEWAAIFKAHPLLRDRDVPEQDKAYQDVFGELRAEGVYGGSKGVTHYLNNVIKERYKQAIDYLGYPEPKNWDELRLAKVEPLGMKAIQTAAQWPSKPSSDNIIDLESILEKPVGKVREDVERIFNSAFDLAPEEWSQLLHFDEKARKIAESSDKPLQALTEQGLYGDNRAYTRYINMAMKKRMENILEELRIEPPDFYNMRYQKSKAEFLGALEDAAVKLPRGFTTMPGTGGPWGGESFTHQEAFIRGQSYAPIGEQEPAGWATPIAGLAGIAGAGAAGYYGGRYYGKYKLQELYKANDASKLLPELDAIELNAQSRQIATTDPMILSQRAVANDKGLREKFVRNIMLQDKASYLSMNQKTDPFESINEHLVVADSKSAYTRKKMVDGKFTGYTVGIPDESHRHYQAARAHEYGHVALGHPHPDFEDVKIELLFKELEASRKGLQYLPKKQTLTERATELGRLWQFFATHLKEAKEPREVLEAYEHGLAEKMGGAHGVKGATLAVGAAVGLYGLYRANQASRDEYDAYFDTKPYSPAAYPHIKPIFDYPKFLGTEASLQYKSHGHQVKVGVDPEGEVEYATKNKPIDPERTTIVYRPFVEEVKRTIQEALKDYAARTGKTVDLYGEWGGKQNKLSWYDARVGGQALSPDEFKRFAKEVGLDTVREVHRGPVTKQIVKNIYNQKAPFTDLEEGVVAKALTTQGREFPRMAKIKTRPYLVNEENRYPWQTEKTAGQKIDQKIMDLTGAYAPAEDNYADVLGKLNATEERVVGVRTLPKGETIDKLEQISSSRHPDSEVSTSLIAPGYRGSTFRYPFESARETLFYDPKKIQHRKMFVTDVSSVRAEDLPFFLKGQLKPGKLYQTQPSREPNDIKDLLESTGWSALGPPVNEAFTKMADLPASILGYNTTSGQPNQDYEKKGLVRMKFDAQQSLRPKPGLFQRAWEYVSAQGKDKDKEWRQQNRPMWKIDEDEFGKFITNSYEHVRQDVNAFSPADNWVKRAMEGEDVLDIEPGIFKKGPQDIAASLKKSAEAATTSTARSPFQSAMSMLNFYINRMGKNLQEGDRVRLEIAKEQLRKVFGREDLMRAFVPNANQNQLEAGDRSGPLSQKLFSPTLEQKQENLYPENWPIVDISKERAEQYLKGLDDKFYRPASEAGLYRKGSEFLIKAPGVEPIPSIIKDAVVMDRDKLQGTIFGKDMPELPEGDVLVSECP